VGRHKKVKYVLIFVMRLSIIIHFYCNICNYFSIIISKYLIIIFVIKYCKFKYSFTQMIGDKITLI
jgi:hypothetical protein